MRKGEWVAEPTLPVIPANAGAGDDRRSISFYPLPGKTGRSAIVLRAPPLEYVGTVGSILIAAHSTAKHINGLVVVVAGQIRLADYRLTVAVCVACPRRALVHGSI